MTATSYRKRPVVVEAMQWLPDDPSSRDVAKWLQDNGGAYQLGIDLELSIRTLEGPMRADAGDWIIRGVAGEFYPCKPEIFEATYDPADTWPTFAELVELDPSSGIKVDGRPFPWYIAEDATIELDGNADIVVRVGILTERAIGGRADRTAHP